MNVKLSHTTNNGQNGITVPTSPGFRPVPMTGVIYVMTEAEKLGYTPEDASWVNLGQGAPEIGSLEGAPERVTSISLAEEEYEYAPVSGLRKLKKAVAELYNERYRKNSDSKYTEKNVAICSGGRLAVTRAVAALGRANIGHFLPDYTAYEELLGSFGSFVPIPILVDDKAGYKFDADSLRNEVLGRGLSAVLLSNPSNPTGRLLSSKELSGWTDVAREHRCTLIFDEFYSHYIYNGKNTSISSAEFVKDVNEDPIIVIDGLTKNWRYPGFRVSWTLGPESVIKSLSSAGSFLDGGCAHPIQSLACELVSKELADKEAQAIQKKFSEKRDYMVKALEGLGIKVDPYPEAGFYCWGDLSGLPEHLNTGMKLFRAALEQKVITVPGEFFDINPGQRRSDRPSRFRPFSRFSFGPEQEKLERGIAGISKLLA